MMQAKQYNAMDTNFYSNGLNYEHDFKEQKFKNIMLLLKEYGKSVQNSSFFYLFAETI